jgi:hypothetical protein
MEEVEYFEFFLKMDTKFEKNGTLYIQMGEFGEDLSLNGGPPNGVIDAEYEYTIDLNMVSYDPDKDRGVDALFDLQEIYLIPSSSVNEWDTLKYGDSLLGRDSLDPAKDNYRQYYYDNGGLENFRFTCRKQLDGIPIGSEDINNDRTLSSHSDESYFQFTIELDDFSSPWIDTTVDLVDPEVWRKFKIPLKRRTDEDNYLTDTVNGQQWSNVKMVRLIWTHFDPQFLETEHRLVLARFNFLSDENCEEE